MHFSPQDLQFGAQEQRVVDAAGRADMTEQRRRLELAAAPVKTLGRTVIYAAVGIPLGLWLLGKLKG